MMEEKDILPSLNLLGLDLYEAKTYLALISHGPKAGGELSFLGGVPRSKIYGALKSLERKNLIKGLGTKPLMFEALPPFDTLKLALDRVETDARKCSRAIEFLTLKHESLKHTRRVPYAGDISAFRIKGRKENLKQLSRMLNDASKSIRLALTKNTAVQLYKSCMDELVEANERNVKITILVPKDINSRIAEDLRDIAQLRTIDVKLSGILAYIDSKEALFIETVPDNIQVDRGEDVGAYLLHQKILSMNEVLFDLVSDQKKK